VVEGNAGWQVAHRRRRRVEGCVLHKQQRAEAAEAAHGWAQCLQRPKALTNAGLQFCQVLGQLQLGRRRQRPQE
jgi:hypothetical protein